MDKHETPRANAHVADGPILYSDGGSVSMRVRFYDRTVGLRTVEITGDAARTLSWLRPGSLLAVDYSLDGENVNIDAIEVVDG